MHTQLCDVDERRVTLRAPQATVAAKRRKRYLPLSGVAFWEQVRPYLPELRAYLVRRALQYCDAEDILQETLLRTWARSRCEEITHPKSYLVQVARSVIIDRARRASVRQGKNHCALEDWHHPIDPLDPARVVLAREELVLLAEGVNLLPARTRDILVAVRIRGKSIKVTAEDFGISVSAVEKHLSRALASLAKHIRAKDFDEGGICVRTLF